MSKKENNLNLIEVAIFITLYHSVCNVETL